MINSATSWAVGLLGLADWAIARETASSSTSTAATPSGTPISGDYTGQHRPQVHFSPPEGFMNDPNGMFRDEKGIWHLYYQLNPDDTVPGNQHWGHATSEDLYTWENQPIALFPPDEETFVWSGSAVIDEDNTSGFFPNQTDGVVAIYTLSGGSQTQNIAYSRDGGYTFTPYEDNPVIPSDSNQFRDPKVIWYEDHWVMAIAYAADFEIGIFTSPDLIDWTATSNFSHHGLLGMQYECPNLLPMPYIDENGDRHDDMWLMYISISPGAPLGGSIGQYFPGKFNGTHFEAVDAAARIADFGKDNYASQWFYGLDEDEFPVSVPWASNWQYAHAVPTGDSEGWRSTMGLPRKNYLTKVERVGWKLVSTPYDMTPVIGEDLLSEESMENGEVIVDFADVESNAITWQANVTDIPEDGMPSTLKIEFEYRTSDGDEYIRGGINLGGDALSYVDRGGAKGYDDPFFTDKFSVTSMSSKNSWSASGTIDRSIFEFFVDGGVESATNTFFTKEALTSFKFKVSDLPDEVNLSLRVNALKGTW